MGQRRLDEARAAVESRLDSLFHSGWTPGDDEADSATGGVSTDTSASGAAVAGLGGPQGAQRRWRIDPGRRAAAAMVAVVALTAALVGWRVLADRPRAEALPDSATVRVSAPASPGAVTSGVGSATAGRPSAPSGAVPAPVAASSSSATIVVDVVGKVHHPGIVRLRSGSRVDDAVRAAGGVLAHANLRTLNLARVCLDGEQIVVGQPGSAAAPAVPAASSPATAGSGAPGASGAGGLINLNNATAEQLDTLPGVGPVMSQRIIDWRTTHGAFASVDQLKQVSGIGEAKYADMSPLVTV